SDRIYIDRESSTIHLRVNQVAFDGLQKIFGLARTIKDAEASSNGSLLFWRIRQAKTRTEIGLHGFIKSMVCRQDLAGDDVKLNIQIIRLAKRRIVLVSNSVVHRELGCEFEFVLSVEDGVFLFAFTLPSRSVVEDAGV